MNHRLTITAALATLATSLGLIPVMSGGKWFFGGAGAIIVTAGVGTATRHRALRALPAAVCLLCALAALVLYLNVVYASGYSYLGLIPSAHSLSHLWQSAITGLHDTQRYTAPVPSIASLELLASGGIGLVAAVTDLIAVRLRRCALAGLPLLVLFSVPAATDASKNGTEDTVLFCVAMAGYLALLSADGRERLRLWGRLVTPWNAADPNDPAGELGSGPSARALAASGRRIGLAAVVLALFAPLLVPGLHAHKLFSSSGGLGNGNGPGGPGGGPSTNVNPLVQMTRGLQQAKPSLVFTYHTNDPDPQYLVEYVLNKMTATEASWVPPTQKSMAAVSRGAQLPRVPGLVSSRTRTVRTTVHMDASATLGQSFLPLPYAPRQLTLPASGLLVDPATLMVWSPLANLSRLSYTVTSIDITPTAAQLAAATAPATGMGSYLSVPPELRTLRSLADEIAANATTPYAEAQSLQEWLRSGRFSYDVHATEPDNSHALYDFLYRTKKGYCQQFSFAMTVLARLLGIPARVAVGYDTGTSEGHGNYEVQTSDEHAWTQLYFSGLGWTTWDPTPPGSAVGQVNEGPPAYTVAPTYSGVGTGIPPNTGQGRSATGIGSTITHRRTPGLATGQKQDAAYHGDTAGTTARLRTGGGLPVALIVLAGLLAAGLVAPRVARSWTRRRRWMTAHGDAGRAHAAWAELLDDLEDHGIEHGPGETPRAVAKRITVGQRLDDGAREALDRLARAEERASYARAPGPAAALTADLTVVRRALTASVSKGARWRARLLPRSSAARIRHAEAHALDVFSWAEMAVTRLAARFVRARARARQA